MHRKGHPGGPVMINPRRGGRKILWIVDGTLACLAVGLLAVMVLMILDGGASRLGPVELLFSIVLAKLYSFLFLVFWTPLRLGFELVRLRREAPLRESLAVTLLTPREYLLGGPWRSLAMAMLPVFVLLPFDLALAAIAAFEGPQALLPVLTVWGFVLTCVLFAVLLFNWCCAICLRRRCAISSFVLPIGSWFLGIAALGLATIVGGLMSFFALEEPVNAARILLAIGGMALVWGLAALLAWGTWRQARGLERRVYAIE